MQTTAQKDGVDTERIARQLTPTIQHLSERYTSGLMPAPQIPVDMRLPFYGDMEDFSRTMATALSQQVVNSFETTDDLNGAIDTIGAEFQGQMRRLSNILKQNDQDFRSYLALAEPSDYPYYVFLSEKSPVTCERCLGRHGDLFTLEDISEGGNLPPLHFHCRCRLVAMDSQMAMIYRRSSAGMIALLDGTLDESFGGSGGIFYLTHDAYFRGISAETIRRLELPPLPAIMDAEHTEPAWYENLAQWAAEFGTDAVNFVDAFFQRGQGLFIRADETLKENPLLGLLLWADALALGIPSALWEGVVHRWDMIEENPSPYAVLNFLTLGLGELIDGAIAPEEPWSFQHFMDMFGLLTLIYGATKGIQGALGADDAAGMADNIAGTLDDTLDDAARAAVGSVDNVLDDAAREIGEVIKMTPADEINLSYLKTHPTHQPPYWPGTQVYQVRLTQHTSFVRVYGGRSAQNGQWIMNADDITGLTAEQIMDKFSLPQKPTYICDVALPTGTILEISGANGILGSSGGGVQYYIPMDRLDAWFSNGRILE